VGEEVGFYDFNMGGWVGLEVGFLRIFKVGGRGFVLQRKKRGI